MALVAAAAVALEGIVATRAMVGLDTNTVMAGRELLSAVMFGLVVLVVPGAVARWAGIVADAGLVVLIAGAGVIGGYSYVIWYRSIRKIGVARAMALNISYAMWGVLFAWIVLARPADAPRDHRMRRGERGRRADHPLGSAWSGAGGPGRDRPLHPGCATPWSPPDAPFVVAVVAAGRDLHHRRQGGEVVRVPGGLHDEDVAHRVRHDLAGHRAEQLALLGAQPAVADDDEVLRVVPGRLSRACAGAPRRSAARTGAPASLR